MRRTIITLLLALSSCTAAPIPTDYPEISDFLPSFTVTTDDGKEITSAELSKGRCLVVFFHTGCPDCTAELDILQPFHEKYGEEVRLVLISRSEGPESIRKYWESHGYTMPFSAQKDRGVYSLFSSSGIPYTVLSENGTIIGLWNDRDMFSEGKYRKAIQEIQ